MIILCVVCDMLSRGVWIKNSVSRELYTTLQEYKKTIRREEEKKETLEDEIAEERGTLVAITRDKAFAFCHCENCTIG